MKTTIVVSGVDQVDSKRSTIEGWFAGKNPSYERTAGSTTVIVHSDALDAGEQTTVTTNCSTEGFGVPTFE